MRARIGRMLAAVASGDLDRDPIAARVTELLERAGVDRATRERRAEEALIRLGSAFVGTVHSFGQSLLATYGHHVGLGGGRLREPSREAAEALGRALDEAMFSPPASVAGRLDPETIARDVGGARAGTIRALASSLAALDLDGIEAGAAGGEWVRDLALDLARRARGKALGQGALGFQDMLSLARRLLATRPDVAAAVAGRYRQVLVDEMQDTDPCQYGILAAIAAASCPRRPVFFLVGDPKQSIYAFRNADIGAFHAFVERAVAAGLAERVSITVNFRSRPGVLAFVNAAVGPLMTGEQGVQARYEALLPCPARLAVAPGEPSVELLLQGVPGIEGATPGLKAGPARDAQAARLVAVLKEGRGARPWKDVAVLVKGWNEVRLAEAALRVAGIPHVVAGNRFLYARQEARDVLAVLEVLTEPWNTLAAAVLLRSPAGGMTDADLLALSAAGGLDASSMPEDLPPGLAERLQPLASAIARLRDRAAEETAADLLATLERDLPLGPLYAPLGEGEVLNVRRLLASLSEEARRAALTLWDVKDLLRRRIDEEAQETESAVVDEDLDAVYVGTIHGAKGLEFGTVVLPFFDLLSSRGEVSQDVLEAGDRVGMRWERGDGTPVADDTYQAESARQRRMKEAEAVRVAYVALTRAKERLVVMGALDLRGADKRVLPRLWQALVAGSRAADEDLWTLAVPGFEGRGPEVVVARGVGEAPRRKPGDSHLVFADVDLDAAIRYWNAARGEREALQARPWLVSPSSLDEARHEAAEKADDSPPARTGSRDDAIAVGLLAHGILETMDFTDVEGSLAAAAASRPPSELLDRAVAAVRTFLGGPAGRELAASEILGREVPFAIGDEGRAVVGRIDVVYRVGDRVVVGDYKSGSQAASAGLMEAGHEEQRRIYLKAAAGRWPCEPIEFRFLPLLQAPAEP
jgi:ATP-dependent helicase/nuclease subunit A